MWCGCLIVGMLIGAALAYAACTMPDWWTRREFEAIPDVAIIEPTAVPVESVTVGGMTFELAKERNGHLDLASLASSADRQGDDEATADATAGSRRVRRLLKPAGND